MTTKLEMMVGYLAGRQGKAAESIRRELEDPASEASRWLEAVQKRSRQVSRIGLPKAPDSTSPISLLNGKAAGRSVRKWLFPFVSGVSAASVLFLAVSLAWRAQDQRLLRLESMLNERESRWSTRLDHLDEALTTRKPAPQGNTPVSKPANSPQKPPPPAVDGSLVLALTRIENRLGEFEERLKQTQTSQTPSDPAIDELRREVQTLRNDVETRALLSQKQSQELSQVVQETLQLLRQIATRPWGPGALQFPVPELQDQQRRAGQGAGHMPGTAPMPDQDHSFQDPAQGYRDRGSQAYPGGFTGPRMQRPGGPG